jgi:prepilin-type N-terminal cleavage/methylation domain-containing protein
MLKKAAFTLIEILIVIFIIASVYYIAATNLNFNADEKKENLSLVNIKKILQGYDFEDSLVLKCIEDGKRCFIVADGVITKALETQLFKERPEVYTYDTKLDMLEYQDLELEKLESFEVVFEYSIDRYNKTKDMIVKSGEKVYIFNSIHDKPIIKEYLSDVSDYFDDKISEVKDAF